MILYSLNLVPDGPKSKAKYVMKSIKSLTLFLAVLYGLTSPSAVLAQNQNSIQTDQDDAHAKIQAKEVLDRARHAISSKTDVSKIRNFHLSFDSVYSGEIEQLPKHKFSISLPDKINFVEIIEHATGKATTLQILNDNKSSLKQDSTWGYGAKSRSDYKKIEKADDPWINSIKLNTSERLLPIILDFAFIKVSEFRYIGSAEYDSRKPILKDYQREAAQKIVDELNGGSITEIVAEKELRRI